MAQLDSGPGNRRPRRLIGEFALAAAETREVESQDSDTGLGQRSTDVRGRLQVVRARETVGEQRKSARRRERHVENTAERLAVPVLKLDVDFLHTN